jgi:hypothetical protein
VDPIQSLGARVIGATDSLKDPHREFWAVAHGQAIHPTIITPRLDPTHLGSGIPESNQDARDTTMSVATVNLDSV